MNQLDRLCARQANPPMVASGLSGVTDEKAAAVMRSSASSRNGAGAARGTSDTTLEVTFGGGVNAAGERSNRIFVVQRQFARMPKRP